MWLWLLLWMMVGILRVVTLLLLDRMVVGSVVLRVRMRHMTVGISDIARLRVRVNGGKGTGIGIGVCVSS
jgi:hypothetical protein